MEDKYNQPVRVEYVIYALVNGKSTSKYMCANLEELSEIYNNELTEEIEDEQYYQILKQEEAEYE